MGGGGAYFFVGFRKALSKNFILNVLILISLDVQNISDIIQKVFVISRC